MTYAVQPRTITRKELSAITGIPESTIADNEKRWELDACRLMFCRRPIIYLRVRAIEIMQKIQAIE